MKLAKVILRFPLHAWIFWKFFFYFKLKQYRFIFVNYLISLLLKDQFPFFPLMQVKDQEINKGKSSKKDKAQGNANAKKKKEKLEENATVKTGKTRTKSQEKKKKKKA